MTFIIVNAGNKTITLFLRLLNRAPGNSYMCQSGTRSDIADGARHSMHQHVIHVLSLCRWVPERKEAERV
jgi:hypothetical protein